MSAAAEPFLMTVEQYRELPNRDDVIEELHWGQLVTVTRPRMGHTKRQYRLIEFLRVLVGPKEVSVAEIFS